MWQIAALYLLLINVAAVAFTVYDKRAAQKARRRIPEARLLWIAALGGALCMLITMYTVRHKTRKLKFTVGVPLLLLTHIALGILAWAWQGGQLTVV